MSPVSQPAGHDVNGMPQFWASFNLAPKRIQNGGWGPADPRDDSHLDETSRRQHAPGPGRRSRPFQHQQAEGLS
jgi:oxalate decarboxylase